MSPFTDHTGRTFETITRAQLATLLENEAFLTAADDIRCGQDPHRVLGELRPFIARYNDITSRAAVETFRDICAGRLEVTP